MLNKNTAPLMPNYEMQLSDFSINQKMVIEQTIDCMMHRRLLSVLAGMRAGKTIMLEYVLSKLPPADFAKVLVFSHATSVEKKDSLHKQIVSDSIVVLEDLWYPEKYTIIREAVKAVECPCVIDFASVDNGQSFDHKFASWDLNPVLNYRDEDMARMYLEDPNRFTRDWGLENARPHVQKYFADLASRKEVVEETA